ncbi:hypothetical protein [Streptomyces sp. TLI_146]|uniref:hypothetical protein n=1 Tax=Streptomyces sp. TLI_146 TaxID=1938858 RepID=UPI000C711D31|nr:hypothetical protein [Streptomyces sp. TLI_146]
MSTHKEREGDPRVDEEARERSSEQRNITAPTPPDVRAKDHHEDTDDDTGEGRDGGGDQSAADQVP